MPCLARSTSRSITLAGLLVTALTVAGCGSDGGAGSAGTAQERAQAGLLQSYTASYRLVTSGEAGGTGGTGTATPAGTMTVARTPSSLRLDITTGTGTSTSITTPQRTVACQEPASGKPPTCLVVAGAGRTPPAAFDPVLRKAFGDVLRTFAADPEGLTVEADPEATASAAGVDCRTFTVTASPKGKVPSGTYCLSSDGVPVRLAFPSGDAVLTKIVRTAPAGATFTPPASPTPLPSAAD